MFIIPIPQNDIPLLNSGGCNVTINGQQTILRREGDCLCYDDNRCKILDEHESGDNVQFSAASHGAEDEPHVIIRPDRIALSKDELTALAKAEAKLKAAASDFGALSERVDGVASAYVSTISELIDGLVAAIDNDLRQSN